jgi:O-antigen ligase
MLLAFLIAGLRDSAFRRNLMLMVVVACCFGTIFSFRNWHAGIGEMGSGGRFYSLTRPDTFSAWLLFGIFGAIAWLLDGGAPKWLRWFLLSSIPWQVCGLGLCGFRAAILAAGLGVIMVCLCLKHPLKMLGLVSLAALPVVGVTLLVPNLFNTVLARFGTIEADRGSARLDIWEGALKMFWDRPLAGYGLDNFKIISGRFYSRAMLPHSIYVGTLVELGVIGAVLLLLWLVTLLRKASRTPERVWVLPLITAYIFQAMFLHEFYFSCFWIAIALVEGSPQAVARVRSGTRRWLEPGRESVMEPIPRFKVRASQAFE